MFRPSDCNGRSRVIAVVVLDTLSAQSSKWQRACAALTVGDRQ
jgi:hypothetical protein